MFVWLNIETNEVIGCSNEDVSDPEKYVIIPWIP